MPAPFMRGFNDICAAKGSGLPKNHMMAKRGAAVTAGMPMADGFKLAFSPFAAPARGVLVVFCDDALRLGPATRRLLGRAAGLVARAAAANHFTGKSGSCL